MVETKDTQRELKPIGPRKGAWFFVTMLKQGEGKALLLCLALALATAACYWPVTRNEFVSIDDAEYITGNPHVASGLNWAGFLWAFTSTSACNWHPLTWLSHMVDCQVYGLNPAGHHFTNLLLHTLDSLLLLILLKQMTGSVWRSGFVAALFALHPLHVESVAWASERKDVLSAFFFFLTLGAYARYAMAKSGVESRASSAGLPSTLDPRPASRYYWLALLFFALGLMAKPMLVTLPFVLLLLDYWPLCRLTLPSLQYSNTPTLQRFTTPLLPLMREKLPFFALTLTASVVTYLVQKTGGAVSSLMVLPLSARIQNAFVAYVQYIQKTLWPSHLAVVYPFTVHLPLTLASESLLFLIVVTFVVLRFAARFPYLLVGWFWFLGTLVPTIGLVQVGAQSMADRYMYLPGIGLFVMAVWGLGDLAVASRFKQTIAAVAGLAALLACGWGTLIQLRYWHDSEALFRHALDVTSKNYIAYDGLGSALARQGRGVEGLQMCRESVRLMPTFAQGQYDLGTVLLKQGRLDEAIEHLGRAVQLQPSFAEAHINLGQAFLQQGRLREAEAHLARAPELVPDDSDAQYNLGTVLLKQGKAGEAIEHFSRALRLRPDYAEAHANLGVALMTLGKSTDGVAQLREAIRLNPSNSEASCNLGIALLELKRPQEAAAYLNDSLRLKPEVPKPEYFLALALARQQKTTEALVHAQKAQDLAKAAGQVELAAKAESLLKLCQSGEPLPSTL